MGHLTGMVLLSAALAIVFLTVAASEEPAPRLETAPARQADIAFDALHDSYLARYRPLYIQERLAWWESSLTGTDEAFARRRQIGEQLVELHSDRPMFAELKSLKENGQITDPVRKRVLDVMYRAFLPAQADPELRKRIVALEGDVEQIFNTHRGLVGGQPSTENDIRKVLAETQDSVLAEEAWKAYMEVGAKVQAKLRELVRLRNDVARQLGYNNFFEMKLALDEVDPADLLRLFDELDDLTGESFAALKQQIDAKRAAHFSIAPAELRPWHYGDLFFQEVPPLYEVSLDDAYAGKDLVALTAAYYRNIGMPIEDILARSDLYEKPGKSPHAYCEDMDREGDIRIFCNLKTDTYWMDTLLHEMGHGVYDQHIRRDLPFLLREAANSITTEGVAMLFGAVSKNGEFLDKVVQPDPARAAELRRVARDSLRAEKLIFSRWTQVMVRFEQGMYADPGQDLGKLWWDLKKRYQLLNPPEDTSRPDYGAKNHIVASPVYYHSYMLGDLFACQVRHAIVQRVPGIEDPWATSFFGRKEAGDFLKANIFAPGDLYPWNELTRRATGQPLTARYFAEMFVN